MPGNRPALVGEEAVPTLTTGPTVTTGPTLTTGPTVTTGPVRPLAAVPSLAQSGASAAQLGAASLTTQAPTAGAVRRSLTGRRHGTAALRLISPVIVLVGWQLVSKAGLISAQKLPPPTQVWSTAISLITTDNPAYGTLQGAMLVSLGRVAIGFAIGGTVGLVLAIVAGLSRFGENAVDPPMQMLRTLPLFGLLPLFIVWFGIGLTPKIILIATGSAIPLYLNAFAGIRNVDPKLGELARVLHLNRRELITKIVLPGAMPQILVGLRQSLGVAWLALVVAEQVNANAGLGFMISQATQFLRNDVIIVALVVYCILGLVTDWLVRVLERRALAWRRSFVAA